jgi:hypothetical protein
VEKHKEELGASSQEEEEEEDDRMNVDRRVTRVHPW